MAVMRLFVALCLPDALKADLSDLQSRLPQTGRPVAEDNLHLTLSFLGDMDESGAEASLDALETLTTAPITLTLAGAENFGGHYGGALGLNADGGVALRDLQARCLSRLHGAGITPERRRFRPHVTLFRIRGKQDARRTIAALNATRLGPATCHGFGLFQSTLRPDGAVYEPLGLFPLRG
ncbi:MAG: RNA 2',3'-cyclic phosphodiesterase [Pelagimonas sp.]|jgi:2'-5' RNA ligase|nr:RNA 2',3'-cyclic phosphodiesterase [Pelagimonas sp.]